jgi:4-hydroxy-tetrahydrodipicolinate reductase
MKIALIGYGRMGKEIEKIAIQRKHNIVLKIDMDNQEDLNTDNLKNADVAIDFSFPDAAYPNILKCFEANVPIVCGTTGWLDKIEDVKTKCITQGKSFFYASNFSLGVNVFFKVNEYLAKIMNSLSGYEVSMEEVHHIHKLDAPSGTALTLAEGILKNVTTKDSWTLNNPSENDKIGIRAIREGEVPGIHRIKYESEVDTIFMEHSAKSRKGFALGAVLAAEFMNSNTGYKTMDDLLDIK